MHEALAGGPPQQLLHTVRALQRRLWWQHALTAVLRGLSAGALVGSVLVLAALWESQEATWLRPHLVAGVLALLILAAALVRGPSITQTARVADRRLGLEERLATALELVQGRLRSPMAARQLDDAWRVAQQQPLGGVASLADLRGSAALCGGLLGLFVAALVLAGQVDPGASPVASLRRGLEEQLARAETLVHRVLPVSGRSASEASDPFAAERPAPLVGRPTEEQLREQMARSRNQEAALSRLARALMGTAAGREAGEQLQRGNYEQAASSLRNLARENDQLSPQAKAELSEALRQAAGDTDSLSPDLARQEDRAARTLSSRDYRSTQQSLDRLSQGISDASRQIVPQQELAQAWQRLQEDRSGQGDAELDDQGSLGTGDVQVMNEPNPGSGAPSEGQGTASDGSSGPGSNAGSFNPNAKPTRLNVAGQEVQIEGRPAGPGEGNASNRSNSPALSLKETDESGAQLEGIPQPTDPVRETAERTTIPLGQLQAVHDYFQSGEKPR